MDGKHSGVTSFVGPEMAEDSENIIAPALTFYLFFWLRYTLHLMILLIIFEIYTAPLLLLLLRLLSLYIEQYTCTT